MANATVYSRLLPQIGQTSFMRPRVAMGATQSTEAPPSTSAPA